MMTWLGTGRVWSLEMMTQFFFPLAKSLSFGLPIGLARASATSSASDFGAIFVGVGNEDAGNLFFRQFEFNFLCQRVN